MLNINNKLFLPYTLNPNRVSIELSEYPVNVFTSAAGIEWRSVISCTKKGAVIKLEWENTTNANCGGCFPYITDKTLTCEVIDCWDATKGNLYSFSIPDDHPLWDKLKGFEQCYKNHLAPFDMFRWNNIPQIDQPICGIFNIKLDIIQVIDC